MLGLVLTFAGKHFEKIILVALVAAVCGYIYVTGRKHERHIWQPKYEALVTAYKSAEAQAEADKRAQESQAAESQERIIAHYTERVHAGNAALDSALSRLRVANGRSALKPADTAPTSCRDYEASPAQLSTAHGEFLVREAARADAVVNQLQACQQYAVELHGVCSK